MCCLALEWHLGQYPFKQEPPSLRSRYLRILLRAVVSSDYHRELVGNAIGNTLQYLEPESSLQEFDVDNASLPVLSSDEQALHRDLELPANAKTLKLALADTHWPLSLAKKARILQMIMQCSYHALDPIQSRLGPADPAGTMDASEPCWDAKPTIDQLLQKLEDNKRNFQLPAIKERMLYLQIAVTFKEEVEQERRTMDQDRTLRMRMRSQGQQLPQKLGQGISSQTRVLNRLAKTSEAQERLTQYIQLGNNLHFLSSRLGPAILLSFPAYTTLACNFQLPFLLAGKRKGLQNLARRLDPKSYVGPRAFSRS